MCVVYSSCPAPPPFRFPPMQLAKLPSEPLPHDNPMAVIRDVANVNPSCPSLCRLTEQGCKPDSPLSNPFHQEKARYLSWYYSPPAMCVLAPSGKNSPSPTWTPKGKKNHHVHQIVYALYRNHGERWNVTRQSKKEESRFMKKKRSPAICYPALPNAPHMPFAKKIIMIMVPPFASALHVNVAAQTPSPGQRPTQAPPSCRRSGPAW